MGAILTWLLLRFRSRARLEAENIVLRQQLIVLSRKTSARVRLRNMDRLLFVWLYRPFPSILDTVTVVKPETVIRWHRRGFRAYWHWRSRRQGGRPRIDREIRALIRRMSRENLWGAPRIDGELLMLGIEVSESTVGRYMVRARRTPSQGWKSFLRNHAAGIASIDLFVVRTISFKLLYTLVILSHARRRLLRIAVTSNPTAEWIAGQVTEVLSVGRGTTPFDSRPRRSVRAGLRSPRARNGHPRSSDCGALALAEWIRRATDRLDPARMSRSCDCLRRGAPASHPQGLRHLL